MVKNWNKKAKKKKTREESKKAKPKERESTQWEKARKVETQGEKNG
jgi:hypothetical protein